MNQTTNFLPDLRKLNQRLALDGVRVRAFLDGLMPRVDTLLEAAKDGNMAEIGRTSHFIQRCCDVYGYEELAAKAGEVCELTAARASAKEISSKVIRLAGAFARTTQRSASAQESPQAN